MQSTHDDVKDSEECKCILELMEAVDSYIPTPERAVGSAVPDAGRGCFLDYRAAERLRRAESREAR